MEKCQNQDGCKSEYRRNLDLKYTHRNQAIEIKMKTSELLYKQLEKLAEESKSLKDEQRYRALEVMALLGQAILQD